MSQHPCTTRSFHLNWIYKERLWFLIFLLLDHIKIHTLCERERERGSLWNHGEDKRLVSATFSRFVISWCLLLFFLFLSSLHSSPLISFLLSELYLLTCPCHPHRIFCDSVCFSLILDYYQHSYSLTHTLLFCVYQHSYSYSTLLCLPTLSLILHSSLLFVLTNTLTHMWRPRLFWLLGGIRRSSLSDLAS